MIRLARWAATGPLWVIGLILLGYLLHVGVLGTILLVLVGRFLVNAVGGRIGRPSEEAPRAS